jgi:hypothetical protein
MMIGVKIFRQLTFYQQLTILRGGPHVGNMFFVNPHFPQTKSRDRSSLGARVKFCLVYYFYKSDHFLSLFQRINAAVFNRPACAITKNSNISVLGGARNDADAGFCGFLNSERDCKLRVSIFFSSAIYKADTLRNVHQVSHPMRFYHYSSSLVGISALGTSLTPYDDAARES